MTTRCIQFFPQWMVGCAASFFGYLTIVELGPYEHGGCLCFQNGWTSTHLLDQPLRLDARTCWTDLFV